MVDDQHVAGHALNTDDGTGGIRLTGLTLVGFQSARINHLTIR